MNQKRQLKLNVPELLHRELKAAAERNKRPLNAEMIKRLQDSTLGDVLDVILDELRTEVVLLRKLRIGG